MFIDSQEIEKYFDYGDLVESLREGFCSEISVPKRLHYQYESEANAKDSTLLIMPAWQNKHRLGVKIITVSPENGKKNLPSINGSYSLMDAKTGRTIMQVDAQFLTNSRTACASALASTYLSRSDSKSLLMIGSGSLAPHLIKAHCSVRPINNVYVWARDVDKASKLCFSLKIPGVKLSIVKEIKEVIDKVDIVSVATLSETPLILGENIVSGQHIDLVGAYTPSMREADDDLVKKASVYVDTKQGMMESGDIAIPLNKGIIAKEDIRGDLFELCKNEINGRGSGKEITLFKSVGHALEDLVAANYFYTIIKTNNDE